MLRSTTKIGRYGTALLCMAAGLAVTRLSLGPLAGALFMFQFAAVVASALNGGLGPGLLTAALSGLGHAVLFAPRLERHEVSRLAAFAAVSILFAWLASRLRDATVAEQEARRDAERAEAEARAVGAFQERLVAMVSHDLRNPLNAITMNARLLERRGALDARDARALSRIADSAARMQSLINDLLLFAMSRHRGGIPVRRVASHVGALCGRVIDEMRSGHPGRALRLSVEGDDHALVDPDRVEQVVGNLVANALKHGAADTAIDVAVSGQDGAVTVEIANQGPAIPPELIPTLFEAFRSGDARGSVGLGLYIVSEIARAHGGAVTVTSDEHRTTFVVVFPRDLPAASAAA